MGIRDLIKSLRSSSDIEDLITWRVDPVEGIDFIINRKALLEPELFSQNNPLFGMQLAYLKGMVEQGKAERNANGFTIISSHAVELGEDAISLFDFPAIYRGKYQAKFEGNTGQSSFQVSAELLLESGDVVSRYKLNGPFLKLAENEQYSLEPAEWRALTSIAAHQSLPLELRNEYENNWLIFQLQIAKQAGMNINLAHFENLEVIGPEQVGVSMDILANGDMILTPTFGSTLNVDDIKTRLGQISGGDDRSILRVKNKFVLLDEKRLKATKEILTNQRIPKEQVSSFLKAPTAYLNAALIDLDTGFSLRVHGAERFSHGYFGDVEKSGVDWFAKSESLTEPAGQLKSLVDSIEKLEEVGNQIDDAKHSGAQLIEIDEHVIDISDHEQVKAIIKNIREDIEEGKITPFSDQEKSKDNDQSSSLEESAVVAIDGNDDAIEFANDARVKGLEVSSQRFDRENLKRSPYPHQEEGIQWMLAHMDQISLKGESSGGLLADDMGLGKTYMTLVAISEWYRRNKLSDSPQKPTLIVAPLSLIENWQAEVDVTFNKSPFSEIVVLQSGGDLSRFKVKGGGRETKQKFNDDNLIEDKDQIRYALKVGGVYGSERLDMPNRLVLTTYQTLRDYQFSLSRIDWGVVAFDEAQNLKNPNALATRAAKGLKADFKLLATGTPVENSLKDFWCLYDTAIPGLLGAWKQFREEFIAPILNASAESVSDIRLDVGRELRTRVGDYMLRRTKAEKLQNLPNKRIYTGDSESIGGDYLSSLAGVMKGDQLSHYDDIIAQVQSTNAEDKQRVILSSLRRLKVSSIHHDVDSKVTIANGKHELLKQANSSTKIQALIALLKEIEARGEKVLIFSETKAVQAYVCALIGTIFKIPVEIINGETKAVPTKKDVQTRKGIIDVFQSKAGFGVIVMSPVAAGVGLTVVGANNVIHLERHWNPAKEAQATDRVYRIGQKKDVNVYIPMALHPTQKSFDLQLNGLLANKIDLSDAVVATKAIEARDLSGCF